MPHKLTAVIPTTLPDAHGGGEPQVALPIAHDAAHLLVVEHLRLGQAVQFLLSHTEEVNTVFRGQYDIAVGIFAHGIALILGEQAVPPERLEIACPGVHATHARGRAHPQVTARVDHHVAYPVVAEITFTPALVHVEMAAFARRGIVDDQSTAVVGDKQPLAIVDHGEQLFALQPQPFGESAHMGLIGIERIVGAQPIVALGVAVDVMGAGGRGRVAHDGALSVETEHAAVLHHAEQTAILRGGYRCDGSARGHLLGREVPVLETRLLLVDEEDAPVAAAHP